MARLTAQFRVQALIRRTGVEGMFAAVIRHGDDQAGQILLKINDLGGGCRVLVPLTDPAGGLAWGWGTGADAVAEADADRYLERQRARDPDLWIIEIEDPQGRFRPDEPILAS
jgi:GMP synthase (glutamine-hydrolysing)